MTGGMPPINLDLTQTTPSEAYGMTDGTFTGGGIRVNRGLTGGQMFGMVAVAAVAWVLVETGVLGKKKGRK